MAYASHMAMISTAAEIAARSCWRHTSQRRSTPAREASDALLPHLIDELRLEDTGHASSCCCTGPKRLEARRWLPTGVESCLKRGKYLRLRAARRRISSTPYARPQYGESKDGAESAHIRLHAERYLCQRLNATTHTVTIPPSFTA